VRHRNAYVLLRAFADVCRRRGATCKSAAGVAVTLTTRIWGPASPGSPRRTLSGRLAESPGQAARSSTTSRVASGQVPPPTPLAIRSTVALSRSVRPTRVSCNRACSANRRGGGRRGKRTSCLLAHTCGADLGHCQSSAPGRDGDGSADYHAPRSTSRWSSRTVLGSMAGSKPGVHRSMQANTDSRPNRIRAAERGSWGSAGVRRRRGERTVNLC
jgi:hypothetical protein